MLCGRISRYGTRFPTIYISDATGTPINTGDPPRARGRNARAPMMHARRIDRDTMRAGRARGPCSYVAQPPPCAPLCNLFRSVGRVGSAAALVVPSLPLHDPRSVGRVCCGYPRFRIPAAVHPRPPSPSRVTLSPPWPRGLFGPFGSPSRSLPLALARSPGFLRCARFALRCCGRGRCVGGPARAAALVGLLRGPLPPRRGARPRPSCVGAGALASLGAAVSLRGFLSAGAVFCVQGFMGFPPSRRLAGFAPMSPCPSARSGHTFFVRPGGPVPASCSGLRPCARRGGLPAAPAPLQPRRGGRCFSWYLALRPLRFV